MPVYTSRSQGGDQCDQRDFYREMAESAPSPILSDGYLAMVRLIDRLDSEFAATNIWLLTSHHHLVLMDSPTYDGGEWLVSVRSIVGQEYFLSYRMPDQICPFPRNTSVETTAVGLDQAIAFIKIAMRASGGWPDSTEIHP
jgi:hypothetical protein